MKKILLATQKHLPGPITIDFSTYVARLCDSPLRLVQIRTLHEDSVHPVAEDLLTAQSIQYSGRSGAGAEHRLSQQAALAFQAACMARDVTGTASSGPALGATELIRESSFTDVLILDPEYIADNELREHALSRTDLKVLHHAGCPVLIATACFERIDEVIFSYDGSRSSLHAIRQASGMFPALRDKKLTVLQVYPAKEQEPEDLSALLEWLAHHFENVCSLQLPGEFSSRLMDHLSSHPNALVVMGGFGRGRLSRVFQPSASESVVKRISCPVFIAHI